MHCYITAYKPGTKIAFNDIWYEVVISDISFCHRNIPMPFLSSAVPQESCALMWNAVHCDDCTALHCTALHSTALQRSAHSRAVHSSTTRPTTEQLSHRAAPVTRHYMVILITVLFITHIISFWLFYTILDGKNLHIFLVNLDIWRPLARDTLFCC